jgi:hypothetical protein
MTHDIHALLVWIRVCVCIAAVSTTAVPTIYAFSPWWKRRLGQIFMLKATSFALTLDLTVLFIFWHPKNILIYFWTEAIAFTMISISTSLQAFMIWQLRRKNKKREAISVADTTPLLTNRLYNAGKFVALVLLPAAVTLWLVVAGIWHLEHSEEVAGTVTAIDTFLGAMLGVSSKQYGNSDNRFAGTLAVRNGEDGSTLHLGSIDPDKVLTQDEVTFKMVHDPTPVDPHPLP